MSEFNPEVFIWARKSAGLGLDDAAKALAIREQSLAEIEAGDRDPSRALLLRMSKEYRRPLLAFYLPQPPEKGDRGQDFRTVTADRAIAAEASIDALVRDIRARQGVVRSILEDEDDARTLPFVGGADMRSGVEAVKASIEAGIGFDRQEFRRQANTLDAFALLRGKVEGVGVFVLLVGDLGSHHSAIPVEAFRGMAIADPVAPFIVINDQDAKSAWSFTLLHELAHLWLGATGVSAGRPDQQIERFCNEVAAEMLVPASDLSGLSLGGLGQEAQIDAIATLAARWRVSRPMVAYRLFRAGQLEASAWESLDAKLGELWRAERQRTKEQAAGKAGGPSYYVVRRHRLGPALLNFASRSMSAGTLSPAKAAQVLGVSARSVFALLGPQAR